MWIVLNTGIYIGSYRTEAIVGISLRLGLVSSNQYSTKFKVRFLLLLYKTTLIFRVVFGG